MKERTERYGDCFELFQAFRDTLKGNEAYTNALKNGKSSFQYGGATWNVCEQKKSSADWLEITRITVPDNKGVISSQSLLLSYSPKNGVAGIIHTDVFDQFGNRVNAAEFNTRNAYIKGKALLKALRSS